MLKFVQTVWSGQLSIQAIVEFALPMRSKRNDESCSCKLLTNRPFCPSTKTAENLSRWRRFIHECRSLTCRSYVPVYTAARTSQQSTSTLRNIRITSYRDLYGPWYGFHLVVSRMTVRILGSSDYVATGCHGLQQVPRNVTCIGAL